MSSRRKQSRGGSKRKTDFSQFVDRLIQKNEKRPNGTLQINRLSFEHGIEKRRLYDLMNVLVACDSCAKTDSHSYRWLALKNAKSAVERIAKEIESRAIDTPISDVFVLPDSPSIGLMTTMFIGAFTYFNVRFMNIRDVALLMSTDEAHYKPILRRLYLVAFLLERVGLFRHEQKMGDYELTVDVQSACEKGLVELAQEGRFPPCSIEYRLNRFDQNYMRAAYRDRKEYLQHLAELKVVKGEKIIESQPQESIDFALSPAINI